jgi:DNA-binding NarL/FixJ family response regulator
MLCAGLPGAEINEAGDGEEALRQIAAAEPDFIFMDIRLPGENGLRLTKRIKAAHPDAAHPDIVIAIITNHDLPEYRRAATDNGASYFIPKDTPTEEILAIIASVRESKTPACQ